MPKDDWKPSRDRLAARRAGRPREAGEPPAVRKLGKKPKGPACPKCQGTMTLRTNGRDKSKFYGCDHYPYCNGSVDAPAKMPRKKGR